LFGSAHTVNSRVVGSRVGMAAGAAPALDIAKTLSSKARRITSGP
jgi:hypothetical protein